MGKLSIPSPNLMIVGGPYKGYFAEYRERLRQGESLVVVIGATGQTASIPIQSVHFLMEDGRVLKYIPVQTGLSLVEVGKTNQGEIITVVEKKDSPSRFSPVFLPEEISDDIDFSEGEEMEDYGDEDYDEDISQGVSKMSVSTGDAPVLLLDDSKIPKNITSDKTFEYLKNLFGLLGFEMDSQSVFFHYENLKKLLSDDSLSSVNLENTVILKTMVMAYVFIHVNNMGIGYPVNFEGVTMRPNDDPRFISDVCYAKKFTKTRMNIQENIRILCILSGTSIVPVTTSLNSQISGLSSRFSMMRVSKNKTIAKLSPVIEGVGIQETLRFPLYPSAKKETAKDKAKQIIISKIKSKIDKMGPSTSEKRIYSEFIKNIDSFTKGPVFSRLNNNPGLSESVLLMPYIREYRDILRVEKDRFYDKNLKASSSKKSLYSSGKKQIIAGMIKKYRDLAESMDTPDEIRYAAREIYENIPMVVSMNERDLEIFKAGIQSENEKTREIMKELIAVRMDVNKTSRLKSLKETRKGFMEARDSYRKRLLLNKK